MTLARRVMVILHAVNDAHHATEGTSKNKKSQQLLKDSPL